MLLTGLVWAVTLCQYSRGHCDCSFGPEAGCTARTWPEDSRSTRAIIYLVPQWLLRAGRRGGGRPRRATGAALEAQD
eukprot:7275628-Pyramimonas_sp.AAC.1